MKEELINRLFEEFDKGKYLIKNSLLQVMDIIHIETNGECEKLTLTIKYERNDADGQDTSKN